MAKFHPLDSFYSQKQRAFRFEADVWDCEIEGELPRELCGALFRVGPDTQYPTREGDVIINGDGLISGFYFADGHVDFRSRYVRTERYRRERAARRRLYGKYRNPFTDDPSVTATDRDNTANTYGFFHHGKLFALREDSRPTEIDPSTLATIGDYDFGGALQGLTMTAHPKIDPETGEWWGYGQFCDKAYDGEFMLYVVDAEGRLTRQEKFTVPYPGLSHDFAVTREHVIFAIMPLTVDKERVRAGGDFYALDRALVPMYGVMPRDGTVADLRWYAVPGGFFGHVMNAWSEGEIVHLDAAISADNSFTFFLDQHGVPTDPGLGVATMTRVSIDTASTNDHVEMQPFPGAVGEMPKIDDRFAMLRYRYGFGKSRDGLMKIDWETGHKQVHVTPGGATQEPVFLPRSPDAPEGDGWILCVVNRPAENRADLLVIDATEFEAPPVAVVKLPFNMAMAFHGTFVPGATLASEP